VFKSSIAKILIVVLFLKIILIMDFDDILFLNFFSLPFDLPPQTPAARRLKIAEINGKWNNIGKDMF
jgi:hypothetical protein